MTRPSQIRETYEEYRAGRITFDRVLEAAEQGIADYEVRRAALSNRSRPAGATEPLNTEID